MESSSDEEIRTESTMSRSEEDPLLGVNHRENASNFTVDDALNKIGIGLFQLNVFCFTGLLWTAQSMVTLQFALLSPSWQCEFQLMNTEIAIITTMYPLGNLIGSFPIGFLCDKYGRRRIINITNVFMIYFAFMSAFAPSFYWIVVLRLLLGILGISGNQATTYSVEFMPVWFRSYSIVLLTIFWTSGTFLLVILCYLIIPVLGWRYLVIIASLPLLILPLYYWIVPISPRFLMLKGRKNEARKVLEFGAQLNCRKLPEGELVEENEAVTEQAINADETLNRTADLTQPYQNIKTEEKNKGILDAFSRKYIITTIFLSIIWFTSAYVYYGIILITADVFTYDHHCHSASNTSNSSGSQVTSQFCDPLTASDYLEYIITSAAEIPGSLITVFVVDIIGRKLTFAIQFASSALFFLLYICTPYEYALKTAILFIVRACLSGAFVVSFLYTGEVYPTHIRASILSILSMFARFSSILTSFSAQVLLRSDFLVAISLFGGLGVFTAIISILLPRETKGKKLE